MTVSTVTYESRLPPLSSKPDTYKPVGQRIKKPGLKFVISRGLNGNVLSRYGDKEFWDLSPYQTTHQQSAKVYWNKIDQAHVDDAKWITFILMYMVSSGRATSLSVGSIINYHKVIKKLCLYATENKTRIKTVLSSDKLVCDFVRCKLDSLHNLHCFISLVRHLMILGEDKTEISALKSRTLKDLYEYQENYSKAKQHAVIPPRIFSNHLDELWKVVNYFDQRKNSIVEFSKHCVLDPTFGRIYNSNSASGVRMLDFETAAKQYRLNRYLQDVGVTNVQKLQSYLFAVQDACRQLLFAYSGMRRDEMRSLSVDCLRRERNENGSIVRLIGKTSKLIGQKKTTAWVTSKESELIVQVLCCIADLCIFQIEGDDSDVPLFVSPSYLGFVGTRPSTGGYRISTFKKENLYHYIDINRIKIEEGDLVFLETVDDMRSWREEGKFKNGNIWSFSSHQYRRTLAYYCRQSGLVQLSSLKRQLKHISKEMSLYYAGGSPYQDLFSSRDHFSKTYENNQSDADTLAYIFDLVLSAEPLSGGYGRFVEENERLLPFSREKIRKKFERGEIAFKETSLGVCTSVDPCEKNMFGVLSACLKCPNSVIKASKLERVIESQRHLTHSLHKDSVERRTEELELRSLIEFRKNHV